jgi:beta-lactam-binding protein with PASTA domain
VAALAVCTVAGCGSGASSTSTSTTSASRTATKPAPVAHVEEVKVPSIVGERFGRAVKEVERAGLDQEAPAFTGTVGNPHYNGHCQRVLNQSPPAGTRVPKGYTVAIVYGVCPKSITHGHASTTHAAKKH